MTTPEVKETSLSAPTQEGSLGVEKGGGPPHGGDAKPPTGLSAGIHLGKKLHTHVGEGPRTGQVWKTSEITGQR